MKLSSILSLAGTIGTSTTLFTSAQHHNLHPPTKINGINSPTNSIVPNDVDVVADAVAVDEDDDVSRKLHNDDKLDMFAMIEAVMEEEFGLTAADGDGRRLSKSNKSGKGIDPGDKVLGFALITVGLLEIVGIVDEDDGTAFLTQLSLALTSEDDGNGMNNVRKLMVGCAILDKDDIKKNIQRSIKDVQDSMMTGGRRLQQTGTNNSLGQAKILVGILIFLGVAFETIVDERLGAFTQEVVDTIEGILLPPEPFTCPIGPFAPGSVAQGDACCASEDCNVSLCGCLAPPSFKFCEVSGGMVDCNAECSGSSEDPDCTAVDHTGTCIFALVDKCTEATKRTGRCDC